MNQYSESLHDVWQGVYQPFLPPALYPAVSQAAFSPLLRHLPASLSALWGLEVPLQNPAPADLLLAVQPYPDSVKALLAGCAALPMHSPASVPAWAAVQRWGQHWQAMLPLKVWYNCWLEFDQNTAISGNWAPSLFLGVRSGATQQAHRASLWEKLAQLPHPFKLSKEATHQLQKRLNPIPLPIRLFQVGFMMGRMANGYELNTPASCIRLCLWPIAPNQLQNVLNTLQWNGEMPLVRQVLNLLSGQASALALQLDFILDDFSLQPTLGIEAYFRHPEPIAPRWERVAHHLVKAHMAAPQLLAAIPEYTGITSSVQSAYWPKALLAHQAHLKHTYLSTFCRSLNHIKFTLKGTRPISVKAYLRNEHLWLTRKVWNALIRKAQATPPKASEKLPRH